MKRLNKNKKAYKYRIYPTNEQKNKINQHIGASRFCYNQSLAYKIKMYKKHGISSAKVTVTRPMLINNYPWMQDVDSLAHANANQNLNKAFNNFYKHPQFGFPKFKKKGYSGSYQTNRQGNQQKIVKENGQCIIKLPKVGSVKIDIKEKDFEENYSTVTVSRTSSGKYFIAFVEQTEDVYVDVQDKTIIGIDVGIKTFVSCSDGTTYHYSKEEERNFKKDTKRKKHYQRMMSRRQNGSKRYEKARRKKAKREERIANRRKNFQHETANALIEKADIIKIEDLNVKGMTKQKQYARSISESAWSLFFEILRYKAENQGKSVERVDKYYASSQYCSHCSHKNKKMKDLGKRTMICDNCGTELDRDINAAINICLYNESIYKDKKRTNNNIMSLFREELEKNDKIALI